MTTSLPSWARVGAKVVYVDDSPGDVYDGTEPLLVGQVYILSAVSDEFSSPACRVVGDGLRSFEFMRLDRFRPLVTIEDDIATHFSQHLTAGQPRTVEAVE